MARFAYSARDRAGQSVLAELEAPSRKDALRLLTARGLQVATVTELQAGPVGKGGKAIAAAPAEASAVPPSSAPPSRDGAAFAAAAESCVAL